MNGVADDYRLRRVLAETGPVFLDFDGPVCHVYPADLNRRAADQLRARLREHNIAIPGDISAERDPLAVLRYAGSLDDNPVVESIDRALTGIELAAVPEAANTPGAEEFLHACAAAHRPVVIVSNNATEAIDLYLRLRGLSDLVHGVIGRPHARPHEMKPHPRPIESALTLIRRAPDDCVLVGDSVTDIQVAKTVGMPSIAYVKSPDRRRRLVDENPDALVDDINDLAVEVARAYPKDAT